MASLMAQAIKRIYGNKAVKFGIGPVIEDGSYYDIDIEKPLSNDELDAIEKEMEKIVQCQRRDIIDPSSPERK